MPKPVRVLEEDVQPLSQRVLEVLESDPENAYTLEDLFTKLADTDQAAMALFFFAMSTAERTKLLARYRDAVAELEHAGSVRHFAHAGLDYYAAVRR